MEVTREEIIAESESKVDTTTPEKAKKYASPSESKKLKIEVAKKRAAKIFKSGYDDSDDEVELLRKRVKSLEEELKEKSSK